MDKADKRLRQASRTDQRPLIERAADSFDLPGLPTTRPEPADQSDTVIVEQPQAEAPKPEDPPEPPPRKPGRTLPWMRARAKARGET